MDKILVLGDIHGRVCWESIMEKECQDLTIFLGDYVSSHEKISAEQQINNLKNILNLKENNPEKIILLRGNHDMQHLGYSWADCSGLNRDVLAWMSQSDVKNRFLLNTQWIFIYNNILLSHAGVSSIWLNFYNIDFQTINDLQPSEKFGFTPSKFSDYYGDSPTQPLTWIRPWALEDCAYGDFDQIVGHTRPIYLDKKIDMEKNFPLDIYNSDKKNNKLYLCDTLPFYYITIENNKIKYNKYE